MSITPAQADLHECGCLLPDHGQQFHAVLRSSDGIERTLLPSDVSWSTEMTRILSIDQSGYALPVSAGFAVITAETFAMPRLMASASVLVFSAHCLCSIIVSPSSVAIHSGDAVALHAEAQSSDQLPFSVPNFVWTTTDPRVASVSDAGVVTGISTGLCTVTAAYNGIESLPVDVEVVDDSDAGTSDAARLDAATSDP